jgi:hypothetical protein
LMTVRRMLLCPESNFRKEKRIQFWIDPLHTVTLKEDTPSEVAERNSKRPKAFAGFRRPRHFIVTIIK